jgi:hypothetical protein
MGVTGCSSAEGEAVAAVVVVVVVAAAQVVVVVVFRFHQLELCPYRSSYRWVCEA